MELVLLIAALVAGVYGYRRLYLLTGAVVYAQIRANRITLRRVDTGQQVELPLEQPFSHERALLANLTNAHASMKKGLSELGGFVPPAVVVHPLERLEGGLTEIEERAYHELAVGAGGAKAVVWAGPELSDEEVKAKART